MHGIVRFGGVSLNYRLMFRICISWATTRSTEGWIIFHIKAVSIINISIRPQTVDWEYLVRCQIWFMLLTASLTGNIWISIQYKELWPATSQCPLIAESPISSSDVTMCPSIPPPPLSPNLTSIIQISYTLYCLHSPDHATNWIHGHGTMEQNIYFQIQNFD